MHGEHYALVRCGSQRWHLEPETQLTFGRDEGCDMRLGHDPEDRLVSRRAGALVGLHHDVLVRNDSRTQPLVLQTFPGPELVIEPLAMASSPQRHVRVVVPGNWGTQYSISIDAARLQGGEAGAAPESRLSIRQLPPTQTGRLDLSRREQELLAALCEPILLLAGTAAAAASYRQIADRLGLSPAYVRNRLNTLRARLSEQGVPGLRSGDESSERGAENYSAQLARWAIRTGVVSRASLADTMPEASS